MYNVLVVCALPKELLIVKRQIKKANIIGINVDFLQTWMWNYNMIFSLTKKLKEKKYDFVVNIGISWLKIMVDSENNQYLKYLKMKKEPFYQVSNIFELETWRELIVPVFFKFWSLSSCISANKPIKRVDFRFSFLNHQLFLLDMESYGFEFVVDKFVIPRIILKVPVDTFDDELIKFDFQKALKLLEKNINYQYLLQQVKTFLDKFKLNNNLDLEKYFDILPFSQRQKEIFEFLYRKYQFVIWCNFDDFFIKFLKKNKNKKTNKKIVTKKLIEEIKNLINKKII